MARNQKDGKEKNAEEKEKKEKKNEVVLLKFLRSFTPYVEGEIAGFDKKTAEQLIDRGEAEEFNS